VPPIEVSLRFSDKTAQLEVSDHGSIIAADARERLFLPFHRVPGASSSAGTGLGLALARQIAWRHCGDVVYDPNAGRNCFRVTLPTLDAKPLEAVD
jgi:signal transduction histidine kinase